jgi:transposase
MSMLATARFGAFSPRSRSPLKKIVRATEQDRPDIAAARARRQEGHKLLDPPRLVFIDDGSRPTWRPPMDDAAAASGLMPTCRMDTGRRRLSWLRRDGLTAPFVLDGAINGECFKCFKAYGENVLVPTLAEGDIVLSDNLSAHKSPKIRKAIEATGAAWHFLPRSSPDLNPIEMVVSKLKTLLRKAFERPVEALWNRIGELLGHCPRQECQNSFQATGYEPT